MQAEAFGRVVDAVVERDAAGAATFFIDACPGPREHGLVRLEGCLEGFARLEDASVFLEGEVVLSKLAGTHKPQSRAVHGKAELFHEVGGKGAVRASSSM